MLKLQGGGSLEERQKNGLIRLKPRSTTNSLVLRVWGGVGSGDHREVLASVLGKNIPHSPREARGMHFTFSKLRRGGGLGDKPAAGRFSSNEREVFTSTITVFFCLAGLFWWDFFSL